MKFKYLKNLTFFVFFFFVIGIFYKVDANAQIVNKNYDRSFTVNEDYLEVVETKKTEIASYGYAVPYGSNEAFAIFFPVESDPKAGEKIQKTLDSIKITNEVGTDLQFSYEETESNNLIIKVPFTDDITYGDPQVITLKYKSYGLVVQSGAVFDVYIPGFPEGYDLSDGNTSETINTKVIIPNEMPELNLSIPKLDVTSLSNGDKSIDIDFDKLKGDTVWLQIGSEQFYEFVIKQEVPKTTNAPIVLNTVDLILPRDIDSGPISQRVYYEEINPEPYSIKEDSDGNLIAEFKLTANRNQEIYIKGYAT
ncbi:MAG: hypothetical protein Q9M76_07615, partial [Candidatus Dojkabacteria bacterium]|nr:hypothetical protein [Candidatus Dojkabacteria bacterium]